MIAIVSSLGIACLTSTLVVVAEDTNYQRLFRNLENNRIITKEDLESEDHAFSKVTTRGNIIEFSKTGNSIINHTPLSGLD